MDAASISSSSSTVQTAPGPVQGSSKDLRVSSGLDTSILRQYASRSLTDVLDSLSGPKILIIDPTIAGPLGLVTDVGDLKHHGVDKLFWLEPGPLGTAASQVRNVVWVCRQSMQAMKIVADQVLSASSTTPTTAPGSSPRTYTLLLAPRVSHLCTSFLSDAGVLGSLDVRSFELGLIPLERDLLSLEEEWAGFDKMFKEGDFGPVYDMASSLMMLQRAFGLIPRIIGKGDSARRLADLLRRLRNEPPPSSASSWKAEAVLEPGSIDSLVVVDRQVDMVTPLCTQLTYDGLLDEIVGIKNAHVEVSPDLLAPSTPVVAGNTSLAVPGSSSPSPNNPAAPQPGRRKKHLLSSALDPLYAELRDKNFAFVGAILNRVAKRISGDYERRNEAKTPREIREFVGRLGGLQNEHQALRLHTGLSEQIMSVTQGDEFNTALEIQQNLVAGIDLSVQEASIMTLLHQEAPLRLVLRLLCLLSLVSGGIKPKRLDEIKREVLQTYGYQHLGLLVQLDALGLLAKPSAATTVPSGVGGSGIGTGSGKSPFSQARKPLRLIVDDIDEHSPNDVSYVFSGYAPLSVRMVQCALGGGRAGGWTGWKGLAEEVVRGTLRGETVDEVQRVESEEARKNMRPPSTLPPTTVVCFLGGVTYAEVAALRFAAGQTKGRRRIMVVTTGMINGNGVIGALMPKGGATAAPAATGK